MKRARYRIYSLLSVLSLIAALVLPQGTASATSNYGVQTTNELHLGGVGDPQACYEDGTDMTTQWMQIMQSAPGAPYSYQNTWNWNYGTNYGGGENGTLQQFVNRFNNSLHSTSGTGWAVSQASEFDTYSTSDPLFLSFHKMIRIWAFDPDTTFTLQEGMLLASKSVYYLDFIKNPNANCRWQAWNYREVRTSLMGFSYNKFLFVNAQSITYPQDYVGQPIPNKPPHARYAGLGDSYSTGEGNPEFVPGTDQSSINECHRSPQAYPWLLQNTLDLGPTAFVACAGATATNITSSGQWNEPAQIEALNEETEVVTLTIGGNDIGFGYYVLGCIVACGPGTPVYNAMMDSISQPAFKQLLVYTYEKILEAAPNADLYVADYPFLAAENATACQGLDFSGAYDVQEALNAVINEAVTEVRLNSNNIFMVETNYPGSPFEGGHLCNGGQSLFNGLVPTNPEYSLHPNAAGQLAYAEVFEEYMNS